MASNVKFHDILTGSSSPRSTSGSAFVWTSVKFCSSSVLLADLELLMHLNNSFYGEGKDSEVHM